jgi:general secretion pathway protein B
MSFILDALRKSDAERQRGVAPTLADVRYAAGRSRRNVWIPLLVLVLVANIGFMAWQWNAGRKPPPAAPVETASPPVPAAVPAVPTASAPATVPTAVPEVRALARETTPAVPLLPPEVEADLPAVDRDQPTPAVAAPVIAPPPPPAATEPPRPSRIVADPALPSLDQLLGAGVLDLPALNLDLLVYNDVPAVRFVVINGRKYREGAQLSEGPTVESITPEGVILASRGQRFMLNRK